MALKVSISFKESEKELYEYLTKKLSASIYIKELIQIDMKEDKSNKGSKEVKRNGFKLDF